MKTLLRSSVNVIPHCLRKQIRHVPGLAALQRLLVCRVLSGQPFLHRVNCGPASGGLFEVTLPQDKAIWAGTYEADFANAIAIRVPIGGVCFDIGGYRGYMSATMALAGATVFVFEPLPVNQRALERLCELNPELAITIHHVAVGSADGEMHLQVMPDASMGKLKGSPFQMAADPTREIVVNVRSLDSMISDGSIRPPDLMKIDVEGAELDVLRGAATLLAEARPVVFLEAHSDELEAECTRELVQHGYGKFELGSSAKGPNEARHLLYVVQQ